MIKVKICGITNIEDALLYESLGANALGFIFYPKSKRFIAPEAAKKIIASLSPFTIKVGVFVNETSENINKISSEINLTAVQLHGDEQPEIVNEINLPVIKSFRIKSNFDFSTINDFSNAANGKTPAILLDNYSQNEFGGTGKKFDWKLIPENLKNKIILSGGISSENIEDIFNKIKPAAIDVSSSLEISPGKKNEIETKKFFKKIKTIGAQNGNHDET